MKGISNMVTNDNSTYQSTLIKGVLFSTHEAATQAEKDFYENVMNAANAVSHLVNMYNKLAKKYEYNHRRFEMSQDDLRAYERDFDRIVQKLHELGVGNYTPPKAERPTADNVSDAADYKPRRTAVKVQVKVLKHKPCSEYGVNCFDCPFDSEEE